MKFLEIINKCLIELNYKEVASWQALTLNDHKRLKEIISRLNSQICSGDEWPFLQRYCGVHLHPRESKITNPINGSIDCICINGVEYRHSSDYKRFINANPVPGHFSVYGEHIYLPIFDSAVECKILYNTNDSALDADYNEKQYLEVENDESLIPQVFQEPLLVYGACMRLKSNPDHNKFKYWYSMYNDALATMRTKTTSATSASSEIVIKRG